MKTLINTLLLTLCFVGVLLSCKRSDPPPAPPPAKPLIVTVPGLASSQLGEVNTMLVTAFPDAALAAFGPDNGFASDVPAYVNASPHGALLAAGHSFGCDERWQDMGRIRVLIMLDPVCRPGHLTITIPSNVEVCIVYRATIPTIGIFPATVHGPHVEKFVQRSHNMLPHDPPTLAEVESVIRSVL